jgi:hypothetical protein
MVRQQPQQSDCVMPSPYIPVYRDGCRSHYHDTGAAYRAGGCRCPAAKEDKRLYHKRIREGRHLPRRVDSTITRRKIRALAALGWPMTDLAKRMQIDARNVSYFATAPDTQPVFRSSAEKIAALYMELRDLPGPNEECKRRAARKGWVAPYGWDDIENPAEAQPDPMPVDRPHIIDYEEVKFLCDAGVWVEEIAERLGVTPSSVIRSAERAKDFRRARKLSRGRRHGQIVGGK